MIKQQSNEISIKRSKLQHHAVSIQNCWQERKNSFTTFHLCAKTRELDPTTKSSSYRLKIVNRKETFDACSVIHGGSSLRPDSFIEGMVDTLNSKFRSKQVSNAILSSMSKLFNS